MDNQWWSWILTVVGVTGFFLAGRKVWWSWYINLGCQALWFIYAFVTEQYGFIFAALVYTVVFTKNAIAWTKEHFGKSTKPTENTDPLRYTVKVKIHPSHRMNGSAVNPRCTTCAHSVAMSAYPLRRRCSSPTYEIVYTK